MEKERKEKLFEHFINDCRKDTDQLEKKINTLLEYKKEFDSEYYRKTFERLNLMSSVFRLIERMGLLFGRKFYEQTTSKSLLLSTDKK